MTGMDYCCWSIACVVKINKSSATVFFVLIVSPCFALSRPTSPYLALPRLILANDGPLWLCPLTPFSLQERLAAQYAQLKSNEVTHLVPKDVAPDTIKIHAAIKRAAPLGYDRYGREYWLMGVQENMSLMSLAQAHLTTPNATRIDPSILIKEPCGWWGVYNGADISALVDSFSDHINCERNLKDNMIQRLLFARRKLFSGMLRLRTSQKDWLSKMLRAENDVSGVCVFV